VPNNGAVFTAAPTGSSPYWTDNTYTIAPTATASGKLSLQGENADIEINGQSLNKTLKIIQDELRIPGRIKRDLQLEKEFAELNEAANHYNTLLEKYQEQKKVWDILQKQDQ